MKYLKLYALLALLLMAGGVTTQAQTEDDFWVELDAPILSSRHYVNALTVETTYFYQCYTFCTPWREFHG